MKLSDSPSVSITQTLEKLRQLVSIDVQNGWHFSSEDLSIESIDLSNWQQAKPNEKRYITWLKGCQVQWLAQRFVIPHDLQGYPIEGLALRLILTWWAEQAEIFINGKLVQEGDLFDSSVRILLTPHAKPGEEFTVALRLVSPGHDIGALMRSQLLYERQADRIDPNFVADELTVLHQYLEAFEPEKIESLATAIQQIDWNIITDAARFDRSLSMLRQTLQPLATNLKQRCFHVLGHAHLDMAWLWQVSETWDAAQRTFASVLNLQKDFPNLTFCHTSPALYEWIEKHRPDLFKAIQEAAKAKYWEVLGGMWIEPEVNIISGESLVRQLLYGQRYIQEKFGEITKVAWLPDSFGFTWQLPQILKQSGIEYFVTGKLHWNDTTEFPHGVFWWQSPDGTQLLTLMAPPNKVGVMDTNPITMLDYAIAWENQTGLKDAFWLPGVGDHGGGPTRDMLEVQERWQQSPFFPQIQFTTAVDYLSGICRGAWYAPKEVETQPVTTFPVWNDELYLEFHRGCYTTHADQKLYNRRCEGLLYQAELWASFATILLDKSYPKLELENAWKKVLFNQFHDILPGTSIPEVFIDANRDWQESQKIGQEILDESLSAIASHITLPPSPHRDAIAIVIFNSLNWERSEVVTCSVRAGNWEVCDLAGNKLTSQLSSDGQLLFFAKDIPSVGYHCFWLCQSQNLGEERSKSLSSVEKGDKLINHRDAQKTESFTEGLETLYILENEILRVVVNPETGDLDSIFDKIHQKEILKDAGNQLQAFEDKGQYWDAWNIDPNYAQHPLPPVQLKSIQYLEKGPLQWRVRTIRQLQNSEFCQDYILHINSPILKIKTTVNWQETHVLVKAAFPLTVESDFVTYEIPCGTIQRPTRPLTPPEKAKWEVSALQWGDLTDSSGEYGVSLLNDCKYGYDSQPNQLRLTLLRSPQWPDSGADKGTHQFTYAIYPHQGSWQAAKTIRCGYELNIPLIVWLGEMKQDNKQLLPAASRLLNLDAQNLVLMAFKQSQDDANAWILRCYECHGEVANVALDGIGWETATSVNLLEQPTESISRIDPWKIVSFKLEKTSSRSSD
ncbi:MAG: alpha-mannosidase [Hydrococcus sp. Prado102]|jgi:alpha-mannosidase|nr:alpha-mannosidase [Hydrococcus sp. Prado102]